MAPIVSEDVPQNPGSANSSMDFGQATQVAALQKDVQSNTGGAHPPPGIQPGQPPQPAPQQPPQQPPQQAQPQPQGRLDMNQVFPAMPELESQMPWRDIIRQQAQIWAAHPQAGPAWQNFAETIKDQWGPKK